MNTKSLLVDRILHVQNRVTELLETAESFGEIAEITLKEIVSAFGWSFGAFWQLRPDATLYCSCTWTSEGALNQFADQCKGLIFSPGVGLPGLAMERSASIWIENLIDPTLPRAAIFSQFGLKAATVFPLSYRGELYGVCECFSIRNEPEHEQVTAWMKSLGVQIGQLIHRNRAENEVRARRRELERYISVLNDKDERLEAIVNSALDGVVVSNGAGIVTGWNKQAELIFGWRADEILGKKMAEFIIPYDQRAQHLEGMDRFVRTRRARILGERIEITGLNRRGIVFPIELTVTAHDVEEELCFTAFIRDISQRVAADATLHDALRAAEEARKKAEAANNAKSDFLATMSHEIRTPMNAVIGLANILATSSPLSQKQKDYIHTLRLSADSLLGVINDLLDIAKIEARSVSLEMVPVDLSATLHDVVNIMAGRAEEKGLHLSVDDACIAGNAYRGDAIRLKQVLLNLVSNAIKFTEQGIVEIEVRCGDALGNFQPVDIAVRDTGIGIAQQNQEEIFEKFTQADTSISRRHGGTGLGLAITKTLVEMMGGSISVSSELGKGSTFCIHLNLEILPARCEEAPVVHETPRGCPFLSKQQAKKILLVDDYEANILVASALLDRFGYQHEVARSGKEAIDEAARTDYEAILMDVQMPEIDGLDATKAIRANEEKKGLARVPIIGMTAHALRGDRERCIAAGMDDYISKPFRPEELSEILTRHLGEDLSD